LLASLQ